MVHFNSQNALCVAFIWPLCGLWDQMRTLKRILVDYLTRFMSRQLKILNKNKFCLKRCNFDLHIALMWPSHGLYGILAFKKPFFIKNYQFWITWEGILHCYDLMDDITPNKSVTVECKLLNQIAWLRSKTVNFGKGIECF